MSKAVLCSNCFRDHGLRLDSQNIGIRDDSACPNCGSTNGRKLTTELVDELSHRFFVRGTVHRAQFGGAPLIIRNQHQKTSIKAAPWFEADLRLFERVLGVGFFRYGPRLWMIGHIEPLKSLQRVDERERIIQRVIAEYPKRTISTKEVFYRIRRDPQDPSLPSEYDSPPEALAGSGRLDSPSFPVFYGSQDLQICIHECRITVDDEVFVATIVPTRDLRVLDLTELLQENMTEFESLDLAIHMLFLAGKHAYNISRAIAIAAYQSGYDGLIYPSYFSLVRTGSRPFETVSGISIRKLPDLAQHAKAQIIPNIALFGRPIETHSVEVACINKLILNRVEYDISFGPVGYE